MAGAVAFGPYELDLSGRELSKRGLRLKLRSQSMEVLAALVERPGQLVLREELQARLWPGVHYADFENGLNSAVNRLREVLGDSAREPRYVETISGRGYRFIGQINDPPRSVAATAPSGPNGSMIAVPRDLTASLDIAEKPRAVQGLRSSRRRRMALLLAAPAVALTAVALLPRVNLGRTSGEVKPVPLISMGGVAYGPALSPEGNRVAFSWRAPKELSHAEGQDQCGIYVKVIGSGPAQRLTHGETDRQPAWSPDHRYIAFLRDFDHESEVLLVPSIGGPERLVARMDAARDFANVLWTPDAKWLVISARMSEREPYGIWLLSAETAERRRLIQPPASTPQPWSGDFADAISTDGRTLAFTRRTGGSLYRLYELQISNELKPIGEPRAISEKTYVWFAGAAWAANGDLVYSAGANSRLWRMAHGRSPQLLNWAPQIAEWPSISVREHRLVYSWFNANQDLWRLDLRTGEVQMLVSSNDWQLSPQYSPDGRRIAFHSYRTGNAEIWTCNADGSGCQQMTSFGGGTPRWSPDGRWLALDSSVTGRAQIYVIPADGGIPRQVTSGDANSQVPSWSHDGRWIYFESDRGGARRLWKIPSGGGDAVPVNQTEGAAPFESPDGKWIFFSRRSGAPEPLFRTPAQSGEPREIAGRIPGPDCFSVTKNGVFFLSDEKTVQRFDPDSGRITTIAKMDKNSVDGGMSVSADGAYMIFAQVGRRFSDIMLVENFR